MVSKVTYPALPVSPLYRTLRDITIKLNFKIGFHFRRLLVYISYFKPNPRSVYSSSFVPSQLSHYFFFLSPSLVPLLYSSLELELSPPHPRLFLSLRFLIASANTVMGGRVTTVMAPHSPNHLH